MDFGIGEKTALVFGAGGGLGGAIAARLAAEGARVVAADIDEAAAQRTVGSIRAAGGHAIALHWDISDLDVITPGLAEVEKAFGPVDILSLIHI